MDKKMTCPRCNQLNSPEAAFCMSCGQSLTGTVVVVTDAPEKKRVPWLWIILGSLAFLILLMVGVASLLSAQAKPEMTSVLRARGSAPSGEVLQAQRQTPEKITMPGDVRRWLEHLEQIEKRKNELSSKQSAQMMVYLTQLKGFGAAMSMLQGDDTSPSTATKEKFQDLKPDWDQLLADYNTLPPPAECQELASNFGRAISEIPGITSDLMLIVEGSDQNPAGALEKLSAMQNKSASSIDAYLVQSDGQLGAICQKYDTPKWFSIQSDTSGGLLGASGMK